MFIPSSNYTEEFKELRYFDMLFSRNLEAKEKAKKEEEERRKTEAVERERRIRMEEEARRKDEEARAKVQREIRAVKEEQGCRFKC